MKAVVLKDIGSLEVIDIPTPDTGPNQALVRVSRCGICGSDIRYLHGDNPWAKQTLGVKLPNPPNIILGHEVVGTVERVGELCDPSFVGKRVAVIAFGVCGECYFCKRGEEHLCPNTQHLGHGAGWEASDYYYGGMAEYVPVPSKWLHVLTDEISDDAASLLDPLAVAVHGVRLGGVGPGDTVLIVGAGAVGALAVAVAHLSGAAEIVVADISDKALAVAAAMGASYTVNPQEEDVEPLVMHASRRVGARVIIDTVGASLQQYLPLLCRGGTCVLMAVSEEKEPFATVLLAGERILRSSCNFRMNDYNEAVSLLARRRINAEAVITHRFPLDEAARAFRMAEDKLSSGAVKVVLTV